MDKAFPPFLTIFGRIVGGSTLQNQPCSDLCDSLPGIQLTFLTPDELIELTRKRRHDAQVRMLRTMGIEHIARPGECPAVLRSHVEHLLGAAPPAKVYRDDEPDWSAVA